MFKINYVHLVGAIHTQVITKPTPKPSKLRHDHDVPGYAKEWSLGYMNSHHRAGGSEEAGFTEPRVHSLAHHCNDATESER